MSLVVWIQVQTAAVALHECDRASLGIALTSLTREAAHALAQRGGEHAMHRSAEQHQDGERATMPRNGFVAILANS